MAVATDLSEVARLAHDGTGRIIVIQSRRALSLDALRRIEALWKRAVADGTPVILDEGFEIVVIPATAWSANAAYSARFGDTA